MKKTKRLYILYLPICVSLFLMSCVDQRKTVVKNKAEDISTGDRKYIISAPIVIKDFVKKNGKASQNKEIYVERSIQDYFIKFCESKISREEFDDHISKIIGEIKTVTIEIEFRDGYWDICDGDNMQQSRTGEYVIIHRVIKDKKK